MKLRSGTVLEKDVQFQQAVYKPSWPKAVQEFTPQFFDQSSKAWRENKVEVVKGSYKYKKEKRQRDIQEVTEVRRSPRFQK
jgi:hypothetical protein